MTAYKLLPITDIHLKNPTVNTQTNFDGEFSLEIPLDAFKPNAILVFSYVGYDNYEQIIHEKTKQISVCLTEEEYLQGEQIVMKKQNIFRV